MNKNTESPKKFNPLTQDLYEAIEKIIQSIYENATSTVRPEYNIPEDFFRIPEKNNKSKKENLQFDSKNDTVKQVLSTVIPAGLTAASVTFHAPGAVVVVLSGVGGFIGSFIQKEGKQDVNLSDLELENLDLERLTKKDIQVELKIDSEKKEERLRASLADANRICREMSDFEEKMMKRSDVEINREFGEWIQEFVVYANKHSDDRKIQMMKESLLDRLTEMRIHVYDTVVLNEEGQPDVPFADYLIDRSNGETYTAVRKPAVYSDRALLARGEIC